MRCAWILVSAWLGCAVGCSAPSVEPRELANNLPAAAPTDAATQAQADALGASALRDATAGQFATARDQADSALGLDPRQARARAASGLLAMHDAQGETPPVLAAWRQAEGELLQAQALAPDDAQVALALARFYVADGHGRAALAVLERVLAREPDDVGALRLASLVAYEGGEELRARPYLARLVVAQPDDAESAYRLVRCEAALAERQNEAAAKQQAWRHVVELCQRYRGLVPADVQGALSEAQARVRLWELAGKQADDADLRAALDLYRLARRLDGNLPAPAHGEGVVLEALGDAAGAEVAYHAALACDPAYAPSLLNLAASLTERAALAEARPLWERALRAGLTPSEKRRVEALLTGR